MRKLIISDAVSCVFMFLDSATEEPRCNYRYHIATRNPVKDKCCKRWCPLRKGNVQVSMTKDAWDEKEGE